MRPPARSADFEKPESDFSTKLVGLVAVTKRIGAISRDAILLMVVLRLSVDFDNTSHRNIFCFCCRIVVRESPKNLKMSSTLEINIRSLLASCEDMASADNKDWRLKKYIKSLDVMINELEEDR
jgi:Membrane fusion protein Use1